MQNYISVNPFFSKIPKFSICFHLFLSHVTAPADDTTGIKSIYTVYQGHELMFHVSTMLPYSKENKQQVSVSVFCLCCIVYILFILYSTRLLYQCTDGI